MFGILSKMVLVTDLYGNNNSTNSTNNAVNQTTNNSASSSSLGGFNFDFGLSGVNFQLIGIGVAVVLIVALAIYLTLQFFRVKNHKKKTMDDYKETVFFEISTCGTVP